MKHSILLFFIFSIVASQVNAQTYGLGNADVSLFSKYKIPETNVRSVYFELNSNFQTSKSDENSGLYTNIYSNNYKSTNISSAFSPSFYLLKESDDKFWETNVDVEGSYSFDHNKSHYYNDYGTGSPTIRDYYSKQIGYRLKLSYVTTFRNYISNSDIFYSLASDLSANINDIKNDSYSGNKSYYGSKTQKYNFSLGFGWGKMRNVTSIVSAIRLQERLKQLNVINDDLDSKTIEALAEHFSRDNYYSEIYDRYSKFFWQDIEKTLLENGISISDLNMYGSRYLMETLSEIRFSRNEGIVAGICLQPQYENYYTSSNSLISEAFYPLANAYVSYSHQLNLNSQIKFNLSLTGGPNVIENPEIRQMYSLVSSIGYNYELTDRLVTSIQDNFSLTFKNEDVQNKTLTNTLLCGVSYFIEDKISLTASYQLNYNENKYDLYKYTTANNYVSFGLTYYIDRGFLL